MGVSDCGTRGRGALAVTGLAEELIEREFFLDALRVLVSLESFGSDDCANDVLVGFGRANECSHLPINVVLRIIS